MNVSSSSRAYWIAETAKIRHRGEQQRRRRRSPDTEIMRRLGVDRIRFFDAQEIIEKVARDGPSALGELRRHVARHPRNDLQRLVLAAVDAKIAHPVNRDTVPVVGRPYGAPRLVPLGPGRFLQVS